MTESRKDWYAHSTLWHFESKDRLVGTDLELIGADTREDALQEAHKMLDKYHRLIEPGAYIEIAIGFGDREDTDGTDEDMPNRPGYVVTAEAIADAERLGLTGDLDTEIQYMCLLSKRLTQADPRFNRQSDEYALWIEEGVVRGIRVVEPYDPPRRRKPSSGKRR